MSDNFNNAYNHAIDSLLQSCVSSMKNSINVTMEASTKCLNDTAKRTLDEFTTSIENISSIPQSILEIGLDNARNSIIKNLTDICESLSSNAIKSIVIESKTTENELINSVNDLTVYAEKELNIKENKEFHSATTIVNENINKTSKPIDWKFLIPVIISLITFFLQVSSNIESSNNSKKNAEFETKVVRVLENINNCLEQQNIKIDNTKTYSNEGK